MAVEIKIAKNTILLFTATAVSGLFFFLYQIILAQYLGAKGFGIYSFAFSYVALFSYFLEGGMGTLVVRDVARHKEMTAGYLVGSLFNKIWLFVIVATVTITSISFLKNDNSYTELISLFILAAFFENAANSFINIFKAHEEMIYPGVYQIVKNFLILTFALIAVYAELNLMGVVSIYATACFLALFFSFILYKLRFNLFTGIDIRFSMRMMLSSLSFLASGALAMFYTRIDTVLLSFIRSDTEVGIYNAAYKLLDMLAIVPGVFLGAAFPSMSTAHIQSHETLRLIYKKVMQLLILFILPVCIFATVLPVEIISSLYGAEYLSSAPALKVLIWSGFFMFLNAPCGVLLNATNNQKKNVFLLTSVTLTNVLFNLFFIRLYGYIGASYTMLISEILSFILAYSLISFYLFKVSIAMLLTKPMLAGFVMGGVAILLHNKLNMFLVISLSLATYLLSLIVLKAFSKEDIATVKKLISKH